MTRIALNIPGLTNKLICDCNPPTRRHWLYRQFIEKIHPVTRIPWKMPEDYVSLQMNPDSNRENLPESFLDVLDSFSGRTKDRFVTGEFTDDNENALWQRTMIDPYRVRHVPEEMERIVVAVDPAVTNKANSDSTGIVVVGRKAGQYYVLEDASMKGSPEVWAARVATVFNDWKADRVVVETNNGGDLVIQLLKTTERNLPVTKIHARRGKILRAEPIAGIYEQGRVHHVGEFSELEDQMCSFTGSDSDDSPDNLDALVYAVTELAEGGSNTIVQLSTHFGY
jgi:predicted phage terminase large subunit-like protein